jgi:PAS domain S-box-containing protein
MNPSEKVNILLVDDQPGKLLSYEVMLAGLGENLIKANSANEALQQLLKIDVAVILIDVCMPELDGFELAAMIRNHPRFQKTAIIFISAIHLTESDYLRGYDAGAVDYVPVPVVPELLRAKVRVFADLYRKTKMLEHLNIDLESRGAERTAALEAANRHLVQSEQARTLALAAGNMGFWDHDMATGVCEWDPGMRQIFGVDEDFVPTIESLRPFIHAEDQEKIRQALKGISSGDTTVRGEFRVLRPDGQMRWCTASAAANISEDGAIQRICGVLSDITDRKDAERTQILLAREVDHRARNALAIVQAIIRLARADNFESYTKAIDGRVRALAHTHELLSQSRWQGADLRKLVQEELAPYQEQGANKITIEGAPLILPPDKAQTIGLALHELATNAAKYGALTHDDGQLDVRWMSENGTLTFVWTETGGPKVKPPSRQGFGTKMIQTSFAQQRGSKAQFDWLPNGLKCTLVMPGDDAARGATKSSPNKKEANGVPSSKRILVVEDEALIGMLTCDMVEEIGYSILGPFSTVAEASDAVANHAFEAALLDVNLNGQQAYPLAEKLSARGLPFFFVTGYAQDSVDSRFANVPIVQKPIAKEALVGALRAVLHP